MIIIGDSHVRSYTSERVKYPTLFAAAGKFWNLSSIKNVAFCIMISWHVRRNLIGNPDIAFSIGEPDARWMAFGKWAIEPDESPVEMSLARKRRRLLALKLRFWVLTICWSLVGMRPTAVIGAGSPNPKLRSTIDQINSSIGEICRLKGILFFNPNELWAEDVLDQRYITNRITGPNEIDIVHLSNRAADMFADFLKMNNGKCEALEPIVFSNFPYSRIFKCHVIESEVQLNMVKFLKLGT